MSEQTIPSSRLGYQAYESEEKKSQERKKFLLYIIEDYLKEEGLLDSARTLNAEAKLNTSFVVCDNIDLSTILKEYETYYQIKFGKAPKLCRRKDPAEQPKQGASSNSKLGRKPTKTSIATATVPVAPAPVAQQLALNMTVLPLSLGVPGSQSAPAGNDNRPVSPTLIKPLSGFCGASIELREMVELIAKDIVHKPNTRLKDVIGLEDAKRALIEGILLPRKHPHLFRGILAPNVGILLHGPPGTGKTLLATAIAGETPGVILRLHASSLISKWRGDSEKLVRVLFDFARYLAPSIIFLDEIDALINRRGSRSEHEATRRMQAELLVQLDLLIAATENSCHVDNAHGDPNSSAVTVIAATNMPWELDGALLRRMGKRVLVDLPNLTSREEILRSLIPPRRDIGTSLYLTAQVDYSLVAQKTNGYSGSDLKLISKEAATAATRGMLQCLFEGKSAPRSLDMITTDSVLGILTRVRPSANYEVERFHQWHLSYGST